MHLPLYNSNESGSGPVSSDSGVCRCLGICYWILCGIAIAQLSVRTTCLKVVFCRLVSRLKSWNFPWHSTR